MSDQRRAVVAVVLCMAIIFGWQYLMRAFAPTPPPAQQTGTLTSPAGSGSTATAPGAQAPAAAPAAPAQVAPEQLTVVERPGLYRATVTSHGAALSSFELLAPKFHTRDLRRLVSRNGQVTQERPRGDVPINLLASYRPALNVELPQSDVTLPEKQAFTLIGDETWPDGKRKLSYELVTSDLRLVKSFIFWPAAYQVDLVVELTNKRSTPVKYHLALDVTGYQDPTQKPGGMFSARVPQNEVLWDIAGKRRSLNLEALLENKADPEELRGDLRWLGIGQQYFLFAAALPHGAKNEPKQARAAAEPTGALRTSVELSEQVLPPGQTHTLPVAVFAGPKLPQLTDSLWVNGQSAGLSSSIDYTLESIARPLLWVLQQIFLFVKSWALAIVLLTCLIKLLTVPLSHKSMKSMKAMQEQMAQLKPEVDEIKRKYADDPGRVNQETMALYQKRGINPLAQMAGCLPLFIQMPIYLALYSMLGNAVELYRVPFLWIPDLTLADPYYVLPLLTGALMYFQTKLTPAAPDPQQKMMSTMMPIMFTGFSIFLPAGLTLYILTNTLLGMIQQVIVNRSKAPTPAPAPVVVNSSQPMGRSATPSSGTGSGKRRPRS